jgi:glyoxylase-like metal-dependent hydrolase (beta-lactamase superfamily II)/rhodanese-related sulfurtransferase
MNGRSSGGTQQEVAGLAQDATNVLPIVDEGLGNSSYLVGIGGGRALAVDPSRDPRPYLHAATARQLVIAWVAETHLHADFISGARELVEGGATVMAARRADLGFPHRGLEGGEEVDLGGLRIRAIETPGHTPEHVSFVLLDGARPIGVFSGGALLPGAVARTDLISPEQTEQLARSLYRSVHERLLTLPDETPVYPTHGSGSFCSVSAHGERTTTIGLERSSNPLLTASDEDAFVRTVLEGSGSYPSYFLRLREVNRRGPRLYGWYPPALRPLGPGEVLRLVADGAELIDVRPIRDFATGHVPGALSIELRPAFATWLGWLVSGDRPLVFVANEDQDRDDLVRQCLNVGYENFVGELAGGMEAWRAAGLREARTALGDIDASAGLILDVRQEAEFDAGHLPGAAHIELGSLPIADDVPPGPLAVMCGHGERAMTAASVLERSGRRDLTVVLGGPSDWSRAMGRPLERS